MDLKTLIENIQSLRLKDSDDALKNIASSEKYLQQAYEGRYLFELIQNVRDANKTIDSTGSVFIELTENLLTISNTGAPFNEKGVNSITTIGDSPKDSQDFIGFKGIGFKSVYEISEKPTVKTEWGTIQFEKEKTKFLLNGRKFNDKDIPLFFIPHYSSDKLSIEELENGIVTKILLPLKTNVSSNSILKAFDVIGVHQLLLLGCLQKIKFSHNEYLSEFAISENKYSGQVIIKKNEEKYRFKHFKPSNKIIIPTNLIEQLEDKEREIFEKESFIDISIVFDIDEKGRITANKKSKLYLFYPTEITSGFNFIIHSYFIVNPERKALRNSPLNKFILESVADYLSNEWLRIAKQQHKGNFLDFLVFERNEEAPILNHLYDRLIEKLKDQKILYDKITKRFFKTNEIILADGFDKGLFPDNLLNDKRLIYVGNFKTRDWLIAEFKIEYLSFETIAENIEKECERQCAKNNLPYFENLYKYLVEYDTLNLKGRKVLLTSKMKLLSNDDDVFYGFKEKLEFPDSIQKKIHFIHPKVKISDQRQGKGQTGFLEYNTELLVRRILKLYDDKSIPRIDILNSLLKLKISERLITEIRQKILLPVKAKEKWINPFNNPIYVESIELSNLYLDDKFIDYNELSILKLEPDILKEKLLQFGAWDIPAIYFSEKVVTLHSSDKRFTYLKSISGYSTPYFQLKGDWLLDIPVKINHWFTETIINNWNRFIKTIEDENNSPIKYKSQTSYDNTLDRTQIKFICSAIKYLKEENWILPNGSIIPISINEVVGVDPIEIIQPQSYLLKKYLMTLPIQFSYNTDFIKLLALNHLDSKELSTFKNILLSIYKLNIDRKEFDREFISFYNKILSKLFDLFNYPLFNKNEINDLKEIIFLGINEVEKAVEWKPSNQIYYIEDKPSYEILPTEIKQILQPHFTNRDKNKFGQIGKRIGLDFKKVIQQEVTNACVIKELKFYDWFPSLAESLSLIECLLETNIDEYINEIKESITKVCLNFNIVLFKDSIESSTLIDVPFKIQFDERYILYVREVKNIKPNIFYANILNDLLTEILGRDLSRIRYSLNDFFSQQDKVSYLEEKYEVTSDRAEEIKSKLTGFTLTKMQLFWLPILNIKNIINPLNYFKDGTIEIKDIATTLNIAFDELNKYSESINYGSIHNVSNIENLNSLFRILNITIEDYNLKAEIKIDFRHHFTSQIEGIKQKAKPLFSSKLYQHLSTLDFSEKSKFQDMVDSYLFESIYKFDNYVLFIDVEATFIKAFKYKYPFLTTANFDLKEQVNNDYLNLYKQNEIKLKENIANLKDHNKVFEDFLSANINRSLLYFEDTQMKLIELFDAYYKNSNIQNSENSQDIIDLSQYQNTKALEITKGETRNVDTITTPKGNHSPNGSRTDGGKQNPKTNLIGMVAEKTVYDYLLIRHSSTEWISKNAARAGVNPEGSDSNGCDITYVDEANQIQYIEVKGKIDNQNHFYISYPEYCKAIEKKENYRIILVKNALDNEKREIIDIGNIFLLDDDSDVFNNKRFSANFNSLEIIFE